MQHFINSNNGYATHYLKQHLHILTAQSTWLYRQTPVSMALEQPSFRMVDQFPLFPRPSLMLKHHAYIEHKCLPVCFGLEKFHTYIYGRHITTHNDHKTLEMIQKEPIHAVPLHLQRMLLHLQKYNYTIQHKPGREMVLADCLSQFPSRKENMPIKLHQNICNIYLSPDKLNMARGALDREPIHSAVYWLTMNVTKKFPT